MLVETHDDWVDTGKLRSLLEASTRPNIGAIWDINHPQRIGEQPEYSLSNLGAHCRFLVSLWRAVVLALTFAMFCCILLLALEFSGDDDPSTQLPLPDPTCFLSGAYLVSLILEFTTLWFLVSLWRAVVVAFTFAMFCSSIRDDV